MDRDEVLSAFRLMTKNARCMEADAFRLYEAFLEDSAMWSQQELTCGSLLGQLRVAARQIGDSSIIFKQIAEHYDREMEAWAHDSVLASIETPAA